MGSSVDIQIPSKLIPAFMGNYRYRGAHGGRGSGKTRTFALMTGIRAYMASQEGKTGVILCGREYMNSIADSSFAEVKQAILECEWLAPFFEIGKNYIHTKDGRVSYIFAGLNRNLDSIKSKARILIAWIDEAEPVSEIAWQKLIPTVREHNSEIWVTWNPEREGSATDLRFRKNANSNMKIVEMNYNDNPWFPSVLETDRQSDMETLDYATYCWIWEGAYLENSDKQVLAGKYEVQEFDDKLWRKADRLFFGADFGFAKDPSTLIRCFMLEDCLYIDYEAYGTGIELDQMAQFYDSIPLSRRWPIKGDCSRPETISYVSRQGFSISAAAKWQGSVEDGISYLRGFKKIIIHPRCKHTAEEARMYSYKVDKVTGEVLPVIVDAYNHCWDAIRYALDGYITSNGGIESWVALGKIARRM